MTAVADRELFAVVRNFVKNFLAIHSFLWLLSHCNMYFIVNCDAFCHHFNKVLCIYVCMSQFMLNNSARCVYRSVCRPPVIIISYLGGEAK